MAALFFLICYFASAFISNSSIGRVLKAIREDGTAIFDIVNRGYVLDKGRVVAEESSWRLRQSDIPERVFLGKVGP